MIKKAWLKCLYLFSYIFSILNPVALLSSVLWLIFEPVWWKVALIFVIIYILPLACYRFCSIFINPKKGLEPGAIAEISTQDYLTLLFFQGLFIKYSIFEHFLQTFPGCYSLWLRLWGAKIGRGVVWHARGCILDRGFLHIDDGAFIGAGTYISSHIFHPKHRKMQGYISLVTIGKKVFIGTESRICPGVILDDGVIIPYGSVIKPSQHVTRENQREVPNKLK